MYAKLKQDMRNANIQVSDGDDLRPSDMQLARDFLYFNGINIGEEFHRYEEVVHGTVAVAAAPADAGDDGDIDAGDAGGDGDVIGDAGDIVIGDPNEGGENAEVDTNPEGEAQQDQTPDQDPDQGPADDQPTADQDPEQEQV
jgi:hypothetical protein